MGLLRKRGVAREGQGGPHQGLGVALAHVNDVDGLLRLGGVGLPLGGARPEAGVVGVLVGAEAEALQDAHLPELEGDVLGVVGGRAVGAQEDEEGVLEARDHGARVHDQGPGVLPLPGAEDVGALLQEGEGLLEEPRPDDVGLPDEEVVAGVQGVHRGHLGEEDPVHLLPELPRSRAWRTSSMAGWSLSYSGSWCRRT